MKIKHSGDSKIKPSRASRFYVLTNEWYFSVRETGDQGPFISKLCAEEGLEVYISVYQHFKVKKEKNIFLSLL